MKWRPDNPVAQLLAVSLAQKAHDRGAADKRVADYVYKTQLRRR